MFRAFATFLLSTAIVLGSIGGENFKYSPAFYKLLETSATESMVADAVFEHELVNGSELYRMTRSILNLSPALVSEYSLEDKVAISYKCMLLRKAFTDARALFMKEARKPIDLGDNLKLRRHIDKIKPLSPEEWMRSDIGKATIKGILGGVPQSFRGLIDYLLGNDETKVLKINFSATLNRIPKGLLKNADIQEQMNRIYRAYVVMNKTAPKDTYGKRGSNKKRAVPNYPVRNENGKPPVKPYRANRRF